MPEVVGRLLGLPPGSLLQVLPSNRRPPRVTIASRSSSWPKRSDGIRVDRAPQTSVSRHPPSGLCGGLSARMSDHGHWNGRRRASITTRPSSWVRRPLTLATDPVIAMKAPTATSGTARIGCPAHIDLPHAAATIPASAARYVARDDDENEALPGGSRAWGIVPRRSGCVRTHDTRPTASKPPTTRKNDAMNARRNIGEGP